jgi:hypothetical protein
MSVRLYRMVEGFGGRSYKQNMDVSHIKKALGLPEKIPMKQEGRFRLQGVELLLFCSSEAQFVNNNRQRHGRRTRPHRLYANCTCGKLVPAGRLHQHKCKGE